MSPRAALDPSSQARIVDFLVACGKGAKTVIIATHDLDTLEDIADRCYVFANGSVAGEGTPLEILHDVALLERAKLIRPHAHVHGEGVRQPHPHVHRHEGA